MISDDITRQGLLPNPPRGPGAHIGFLCPKCLKSKSTAGRKLLRVYGIKQYVCRSCVEGKS